MEPGCYMWQESQKGNDHRYVAVFDLHPCIPSNEVKKAFLTQLLCPARPLSCLLSLSGSHLSHELSTEWTRSCISSDDVRCLLVVMSGMPSLPSSSYSLPSVPQYKISLWCKDYTSSYVEIEEKTQWIWPRLEKILHFIYTQQRNCLTT